MPLVGTMSIDTASAVFSNEWLLGVILYTLLVRRALAFTVVDSEGTPGMGQRIDALTDELTGLPNRRASP